MAKGTWKDVHYHQLLEKCKSKNFVSSHTDLAIIKNLQIINAKNKRENGEKEPSHTVGENINWYGKQYRLP